jgi:acetyl-CoA carboxylase beta subunit
MGKVPFEQWVTARAQRKRLAAGLESGRLVKCPHCETILLKEDLNSHLLIQHEIQVLEAEKKK